MPLHKPHHTPHGSSVALTPLNSPTSRDGFKEKDKDPEATYESGDGDPAETGSLTQWPETAPQPTESEKVDAKKANLREDGTQYPSGVKLSLIMLAVCLAVFLMALDNAIIATAIPKITDQFHSLPDVGWYGSAYLLTASALQLLFGKFYTFFSVKWVYLTAIIVFEIGSLICGVAQNSVTLIVGRAVAGLGSAGLMSGSLIILAHSVPLAKRPIYSGMIGGLYSVTSVAGPLLGGVLTDKANLPTQTWRWCFLINLPIGAVTVLVIAFFYADPQMARPPAEPFFERLKRFDPLGTAIYMPAIICLLLALQWGGTEYPWGNGRIISLFVLFGILILAFLYVQHWQGDNATVPPRIMRNRSVWTSAFFGFSTTAAFFVLVYYLPIWFQAVQGASAVDSGLRNLPMLISVVVAAMGAGVAVTLLGYYTPFMIVSTVLMSIGAGLLSTFQPATSRAAWIGYQVIFGFGVGIGMQQPLIAVQAVLSMADVPTGTAIVVFSQTLGGSLFVSVGQSVFTNQLVKSLASYVPSLNPAVVLAAGATNLQKTLPAGDLAGVQTAYSEALAKAFLIAVALSAISVVSCALNPWKSVKGKNIEAGVA
ncbi:efflux pump antibiotic resistance protein [Apiospora aurea]|uniref:Efflux pump antibiotic resistance protein n=1 Tax=Apiospora aurea TaxID=335848 RepID=A0ABR1QAN9_9PEZI